MAFTSVNNFVNTVRAAVNLTTHTVHVHPVGIRIVNAEIIELIAGKPALTRAKTHCFYWMRFSKPVNHIKVMNVLLNNMIARQPGPVNPVADHVFHFTPFSGGVTVPQFTTIPVCIGRNDFTDSVVLFYLFQQFNIGTFVTALCSGNKHQTERFCHFSTCQYRAGTNRINGYRFFHEHMLACFHCRVKMFGTKFRRSS